MGLLHRKPHQDDEEAKTEGGAEGKDVDRYANGEEYELLLRYVKDEAQKEKDKKAKAENDDDDGEGKEKRIWYMPWKKVKVKSDKEKKAPEEWLQTDLSKGLSDGDIETHRQGFGYNELTSPSENQLLKFISYFRGPILYVMELAVVISAGLRDWIDFGVIIGILFMNAGVGWYQEKQAGDIVEQLKAGIALKTIVVRNGKEQEIEARELVIGDVVILEEGTTIPADCKIIGPYESKGQSQTNQTSDKSAKTMASPPAKENVPTPAPTTGDHSSDDTHLDSSSENEKRTPVDEKNIKPREEQRNGKGEKNEHATGQDADSDQDDEEAEAKAKGPSIISVDQSAITGESLAVDKFKGETAYYTCGVKRGKAYGVVCSSAKQSFVGKTATLVLNSNEKGHFQIVLGGIGTALLVLVLICIFIVWIGGFFRSIGITTPHDNNLLLYALILFIIGVPVGLPCVTTTTMAVGAAYLARRKCIVQKLTAIEALAGVDILCTDKTGTLTANKLSLNEPYLADGVDRDWFMTVAVLSSSHNIKSLDPIDRVTILTLKDYPGAQENLKSGWKTKKFSPFDPVSKRITADVEKDGKKYTCAKGAPNAILKLQKFDKDVIDGYRAKAQEFAERGFRSLGVAIKEDGKDWQLLGIMSMSDPPRSDTAATIDEAMNLGLKIKMLTGDAVPIAIELAKQLHLGQKIFDSQKLMGGSLSGAEMRDVIEAADGFGEVLPEHKYQVVQLLQERGHLVGMTGDGVNDAPALKQASCGIAVEGASDAARSAAAVVFLDEGLNSIITSIKVARQIFHRMKAYIIYRIALCVHLEVYLVLSMLILNETIRADLIVFLAVFADVATIAIAYDAAPHARRPVEWQLPKVWIMSMVLGLILAAGTWVTRSTMFVHGRGIIQNFGSVQEVLFLEVALTESWVIFITRALQTPDEDFVMPSWQLVGAVFGVDVLATLFCVFGWVSGDYVRSGRTSIVTAVRIWGLSIGVTIVVAFAYIALNKMSWLDNLGRPTRSKKDVVLENFLSEMQRMTLKHAKDAHGDDYYHFAKSSTDESDADSEKEKKPDKKDDKSAKKDDKSAKKGDQSSKKDDQTVDQAPKQDGGDVSKTSQDVKDKGRAEEQR